MGRKKLACKTVAKSCATCDGAIDLSKKIERLRKLAKYCSKACSAIGRRIIIKSDIVCVNCGSVIVKGGSPRVANYKSAKFCSLSCSSIYRWEQKRKSFAARFWGRVDIGSPNECWPWRGAKTKPKDLYGVVKYKKKDTGAHRVAFEITYGEIKKGLLIMHSCDNPPCCNPAHLSEGTHRDNMRDMDAKRRRKGPTRDKTHNTIVSSAMKEEIRESYMNLRRDASGRVAACLVKNLANKYGLRPAHVSELFKGEYPKFRPRDHNVLYDAYMRLPRYPSGHVLRGELTNFCKSKNISSAGLRYIINIRKLSRHGKKLR